MKQFKISQAHVVPGRLKGLSKAVQKTVYNPIVQSHSMTNGVKRHKYGDSLISISGGVSSDLTLSDFDPEQEPVVKTKRKVGTNGHRPW